MEKQDIYVQFLYIGFAYYILNGSARSQTEYQTRNELVVSSK